MDPVWLLFQVDTDFFYSNYLITYYYVPHVYIFMLFVYVIKFVLIVYTEQTE